MSGLPTEIEIEEERDRYLFDAFVELIISNDLVALKEFSDSEIRRRCTYFYSYPEFFHQRELQGPDKTHTSTGLSPLHVAAVLGKADVVSILLRAGVALDVNNFKAQTPLLFAIMHGHVEVVALLMDAGASILYNTSHGDHRSCLDWAAFFNQLDVCRYFIEHVGNNVSDMNGNGRTALNEIISTRQRHRSMSLATDTPRCVMYLLRAVAQRGGPLPRLPSVVHELDLYFEEDNITADDHEFRSALLRVRQWREAATLQRRLHIHQYLPVNVEYEPDMKWEPEKVPVAEAEAVAQRKRACKRYQR
jgi:hypothetical protein